ncbi:uncharacterized protein HMPREF1541_05304 [Cyphellophora europaea CBS 101466]|uniref:Aminoglycoside phosphotransferase domain-containing protein n=1 Tax=Cyphellophora europaea (strain CBS 101466) TaxID=1220924 RepID=W2RRJ3_CYPE1|nr:uncharacterized protein HMPREF1541_05304 [Cyphellophora europaea CBS 101466]ETN39082.1 hypothetical protein HMPREF1541_05304 [Cyphellophora europaea CBS 101466]
MTNTTNGMLPPFLDHVIDFPDASYGLLEPITELRSCHDGVPAESRILFTCRQTKPEGETEDAIMKIKVQIPGGDRRPSNDPQPGPSTTTAEELKVLKVFADAQASSVPRLLASKLSRQGPSGPLPDGYITYTVMTKMPGQPVFNQKYWEKSDAERTEIGEKFLHALRSVYALGIEPADCGLRNVMWDAETKTCSIIDFEIWRATDQSIGDETKELQRWGLARRPPSKDWWAEWNTQGR